MQDVTTNGDAVDGTGRPDPQGLVVWGPWLRYVLCLYVREAATPLTPSDLARQLVDDGFAVRGRATKTVADALRWEVGLGYVRKVGRGRYASGHVPKVTLHRMRARMGALREEARTGEGRCAA